MNFSKEIAHIDYLVTVLGILNYSRLKSNGSNHSSNNNELYDL